MDSRRRGPGDGNSSSFFLGGLKAFALVFCDFRFVFSLGPLRFNAALAIDFKQIALTLDAKFKFFTIGRGLLFSVLLCFFRVVLSILFCFRPVSDYRYVYRYRPAAGSVFQH